MALLILAGAFAGTAAAQTTQFRCGDADGSGAVGVGDGVQVLRAAAALPSACDDASGACDLDGDGLVTLTDGVTALRLAAGLTMSTRCRSGAADETMARAAVRFPGCEDVTAETQYCLTFAADVDTSNYALALLGLESGRICDVQTIAPDVAVWQANSLGWRGELLYACVEQGLLRLSLHDGTTKVTPDRCEAATANDEAVFVMGSVADVSPWDLERLWAVDTFESDAALRAGDYGQSFEMPFTTRIAASADRLFATWHATHVVEVADLASGARLEPIVLEGYDDWVNGIAVTDAGELVISRYGPETGSTLTIFDAATGARLREHAVDRQLTGLACVTRADAPPAP